MHRTVATLSLHNLGDLSAKITKVDHRSCKGAYYQMFYVPLVKNKCQAEGIIAFLHHNIPNFANLMSSLQKESEGIVKNPMEH